MEPGLTRRQLPHSASGSSPGQSSRAARRRDSSLEPRLGGPGEQERSGESLGIGRRAARARRRSRRVMRGRTSRRAIRQVCSKTRRGVARRPGRRDAAAARAARSRETPRARARGTRAPRPRSVRRAPASRRRARARPSRGSQVVEERQVGREAVAHERVDLGDRARVESAAGRLIGLGRVGEAVAEEEAAGRERRADHLADVLAPGGLEEEPLGDRVELPRARRRGGSRGSSRRSACRPARASSCTARPAARSRSAASASCVDFPQPSTPSNVMNGTGEE